MGRDEILIIIVLLFDISAVTGLSQGVTWSALAKTDLSCEIGGVR